MIFAEERTPSCCCGSVVPSALCPNASTTRFLSIVISIPFASLKVQNVMKMVGLGDFSFYNSFYRELSILQITTSYLCSNNFEKNRLQNCLMVSNIQLSSVVSDTFGKSAQAILDKILENREDTSENSLCLRLTVRLQWSRQLS